MISLLKKIFGSSEVVREGISMLRDTGDALVFTEEEKAEYQRLIKQEERAVIIQWMDTTKGQNLARRLLAVMITFVWLLMYIVSVTVNIISAWVANDIDKWQQSGAIIGEYASQMNGAMMLILAFYFAAPHMATIVESSLKKFGK